MTHYEITRFAPRNDYEVTSSPHAAELSVESQLLKSVGKRIGRTFPSSADIPAAKALGGPFSREVAQAEMAQLTTSMTPTQVAEWRTAAIKAVADAQAEDLLRGWHQSHIVPLKLAKVRSVLTDAQTSVATEAASVISDLKAAAVKRPKEVPTPLDAGHANDPALSATAAANVFGGQRAAKQHLDRLSAFASLFSPALAASVTGSILPAIKVTAPSEPTEDDRDKARAVANPGESVDADNLLARIAQDRYAPVVTLAWAGSVDAIKANAEALAALTAG